MSRIQEKNVPRPYNLISNERAQNTDFSVDEMFQFLEGNSPESALKILQLAKLLERDLELRNPVDYYDNCSKSKIRRDTFLKVRKLALYLESDVLKQLKSGTSPNNIDMDTHVLLSSLYSVYDAQVVTRLGIHVGLFYSAIKGNGTKEQFKYWAIEKGGLYAKEIYGCFAMTEMAHGSNVAGLETTAVYDYKTKTFTINTPHIGATKWWIGGAATTANHCVAYARLIVKGEDYGVKTFVVPLRDSNHELHPGVSIGDIGAKMGRDGIDNGWIQFTDVVIPKNFMLQKYVKIDDEEEEVINSPMDQLAYGALLGGRVNMIMDSYRIGAKATTIALRYAVGRRQFGKAKDTVKNFGNNDKVDESLKLENQIIDYARHQYRLLPLLATVYCLSSASYRIFNDLNKVNESLESDQLLTNQKFMFETIEKLKSLFVTSASAKASSTWFGSKVIDECRQACGGHGYSAYSNFGKTYNDWVVQCTWEGDNNVLSVNSGRSMLKYRQAALKGKKVPVDFQFFGKKPNTAKFDITDNHYLLEVFGGLLGSIADTILVNKSRRDGTFESVANDMVELSKFYCQYYYLESVLAEFDKPTTNGKVKITLVKIINLFALYTVKENSALFLTHKVFTAEQLSKIDDYIFADLLPYLRHRVVGLVDSFKLSDFFVNTPLGGYDGDIYNKYFDMVNNINNNTPDYDKSDYQDDILAALKRPNVADRYLNTKSEEVLKKLGK